jgi:hypothetical protein
MLLGGQLVTCVAAEDVVAEDVVADEYDVS